MKTTAIIIIAILAVFFTNPGKSQTVQEDFEKGIKYLDHKEYPQAIQIFDSVIKVEPEFERAFLMRGISKLYNGEYFGAIEDFNKAIELDSEEYEPYLYRSNAKEKIGDIEGAKKDKEKSEESLQKTNSEEEYTDEQSI